MLFMTMEREAEVLYWVALNILNLDIWTGTVIEISVQKDRKAAMWGEP